MINTLHTVTTNPFEDVGASASRPTRKKIERAAKQPMVPSAREKKQYDKAAQLLLFRQWKREIRRGLVEGIYGPEIVQLLRLLRRIPDEAVLVEFVQRADWLLKSDLEVRYNVLSYIGHAMMRWNIRHGLPPFNDSLPGEPDSAFIAIRRLLVNSNEQYHRNSMGS